MIHRWRIIIRGWKLNGCSGSKLGMLREMRVVWMRSELLRVITRWWWLLSKGKLLRLSLLLFPPRRYLRGARLSQTFINSHQISHDAVANGRICRLMNCVGERIERYCGRGASYLRLVRALAPRGMISLCIIAVHDTWTNGSTHLRRESFWRMVRVWVSRGGQIKRSLPGSCIS
jgi:hypothetical protein